MKRPKSKLSYANVAASLALFLSVAGGTTAVALSGQNSVRSDDIKNDEVRSPDISTSSVKSAEVKANTLKAADLALDSVAGSEVAPDAIGSSEIAPGAVGADAVLDGSLGPAEQAAVPAARIGGSSFTPAEGTLTRPPLETDTGPSNFDPFDMWTPTNPDFVTAPIDGIYAVMATGSWEPDDTSAAGPPQDLGTRNLQISAPSQQNVRNTIGANPFGTDFTRQQSSAVVDMNAGETVSLLVGQANEDDSDVELVDYQLEIAWVGPG